MNELMTMTDPNLITSLVAIFASVLFSLFKPQSWSREQKQRISIVLAIGVGFGAALYTGRTTPVDFVAFIGMAAGIMQGFYLGIMERLGGESLARSVHSVAADVVKESGHRVMEAAKVLVHNNNHPFSSTVGSEKINPPLPNIVTAINEVNDMLHDWKAGRITDAEAVARMDEIKKQWGDVLPPFPGGYPL